MRTKVTTIAETTGVFREALDLYLHNLTYRPIVFRLEQGVAVISDPRQVSHTIFVSKRLYERKVQNAMKDFADELWIATFCGSVVDVHTFINDNLIPKAEQFPPLPPIQEPAQAITARAA